MARTRPPGPQRLRPAQQSAMLLARWPTFRQVSRGARHVWEGALQPTPLSPVYTVRVEYADWASPKIFVVDPPLERRPEAPIPHRYGDGSLCLNLPEEWKSTDYIADAVVPWIAHWLHHYETWRVTGEWLGGGAHPGRPETDQAHP